MFGCGWCFSPGGACLPQSNVSSRGFPSPPSGRTPVCLRPRWPTSDVAGSKRDEGKGPTRRQAFDLCYWVTGYFLEGHPPWLCGCPVPWSAPQTPPPRWSWPRSSWRCSGSWSRTCRRSARWLWSDAGGWRSSGWQSRCLQERRTVTRMQEVCFLRGAFLILASRLIQSTLLERREHRHSDTLILIFPSRSPSWQPHFRTLQVVPT